MEVPIVGRSDELAQLRAALVTASGGQGRLVLVSGEPGIGKTRLAAAVTEMAGEYGVPAAAAARSMTRACRRCGHGARWAGRSRLSPLLAARFADASLSAAADSASARFVMLATACLALADAAAERGLLVVLKTCSGPTGPRCCCSGTWPATWRAAGCLSSRPSGKPPTRRWPDYCPRCCAPAARLVRLTGLSRQDIAQWLRRAETGGDVDTLAGRAGGHRR